MTGYKQLQLANKVLGVCLNNKMYVKFLASFKKHVSQDGLVLRMQMYFWFLYENSIYFVVELEKLIAVQGMQAVIIVDLLSLRRKNSSFYLEENRGQLGYPVA